ncbi:APC family permease [Sphingomonas bacterium]|uniref:APC family permease n=1 Tax=Sphingomonas bacterium TaxID=1895847 RepID=UPI001575746A|nr:APC family permease [Sphingomonas bacterium]
MADTASDVPQGFSRRLGVVGVLLLTLSVATPASSVFVIAPDMLRGAGTGTLWALILAAIVCVATGYIYAELSSAFPVAGGEYVMVTHTLGPLAGFVMLGVNVFNNLIFLPVAGLGISEVLGSVIPGLPAVPTAVAVVAACALVGILDIRLNAFVTGTFLLIEVLALAAVSVLGLVHAARNPLDFLLHPVAVQNGALAPVSFASIGVTAAIALFALNGYGAAVYFGEEMEQAPTRIARTVMLALVATLVLEGTPIVAALVGSPDLIRLFTVDNPFGALVRERGSLGLVQWVSVGVALAIVNAIIAWVLACARFFYSTARDGCWGRPIDRWLLAIHPRFGSPWIGTLIIGAVAIGLCFVPLRLLELWSGTGLIAIYLGIALAAMVGRANGITTAAPYRMPFYPLAPIVTFAALGYVTLTNSWDAEGRWALIATLVQVAVSIAYYLLVLRPRGAWTARIPAVESVIPASATSDAR